jgi:hypothetical protein
MPTSKGTYEKVAFFEDASAQQIAHRVRESKYAKDYEMKADSTKNIRHKQQTLAAEHWAHPITFTPAVNDIDDPSVAAETGAVNTMWQLWWQH